MRRRHALVVALVLLVTAGCAGIPRSGPVEAAGDAASEDRVSVRYAPAGPRAGADPREIVRGYLDAMLAYPLSTVTASEFLTPAAADRWRANASTTVYGVHVVQPARAGARGAEGEATAEVSLTGETRTVLGPTGREGAARALDQDFRLVRVDGQWRISNPPAGRLVTERFYDDYYRPFAVYFFDQAGERLVPDLVHLPLGDQLPTALVSALARGPVEGGALRTYLSAQDSGPASVPVDGNGIADLRLQVDPRSTEGSAVRLAAQVVTTLRQVDGVRGVRINGGAITSRSGGAVVEAGDASRFGAPDPSAAAYAVDRARLVRLDGTDQDAAPGPWGDRAPTGGDVVVGQDRAAALTGGGRTVTVQPLGGGAQAAVAVEGPVTLTWDTTDRLWIADRPGGRTRVRVWDDGVVGTFDRPGLGRVTSLAVSPDGGRLAVITSVDRRARVQLLPVVREDGGVVAGLGESLRVASDVEVARSVGWLDPTTIEFLGTTRLGLQPRQVRIDGSGLTDGIEGAGSLLTDLDARRLARGPGSDPARWVLDDRGRLWYRPAGGTWRLQRDGGVTSLVSAP